MTQSSTSEPDSSTTSPATASRQSGASARTDDQSSLGKTTIAAGVVQKIANIAAREISGVHDLGGGVSRAFGSLRDRIPGGGTSASTAGVAVEVGEKQAAVDLDVVVDYGTSIVELARAVRRNVIGAVESMTGLEVIEVNIAVNDIHFADEQGSQDAASRVE